MRSLACCSLLALSLCAGTASATLRSDLALAHLGGDDAPELLLAQRVIERSWGPSEDSVYKEIEIPDWRSESVALGLSAAIPGLGQEYAGERRRGLLFAAAEIAGWLTRELYRRRGIELRGDAAEFAGAPDDPASTWSFSRWKEATLSDPSELEALYHADREVFFDLIASDPRYLAGWSGGDPAGTRMTFSELRRHSGNRLSTARWATAALWMNHAVAAFDALRAARVHDVPLRPGLDLRVRGSLSHGRPGFVATLERRF